MHTSDRLNAWWLPCTGTAGIIGAGTNNARLAGMLRALSSYYYKEPTMLFLVRVAQGLVHMGKGLLTLNPYHTDGQLLSGGCTASRQLALRRPAAVQASGSQAGADDSSSWPGHPLLCWAATYDIAQ